MIPAKIPFFITAENKAIIEAIMANRAAHPVNILIKGKHGLGKSELARQLAARYQMDYVPVPINLLQESGQLMGHDEFENNQTQFIVSNFVKAVRTPNSMIHLEELNRPESPKALGELFPLLDDSRMIIHDKIGEVRVAPGIVFIATLNEGFEYTGVDPLDEALRDRFHYIELGYLPPHEEIDLIKMRTGLAGQVVTQLIELINSLRYDGQDPIHVSTRRSLMMAELMKAGLPMQLAIVNSIAIDKDKLESILMRFDFSGQMGKGGAKIGKGEYVLL
ncbi:MAG TPA: AAA family ATPase [Dehalococcoidales bacterium]|nr:AAA family ATPase [Dehalococcoidales bacterium]